MARAESGQDRRGLVEKASTGVRNAGILVALVGTIGMLAALQIGATIFIDGAVVAGAGEIGRRTAASGEPKTA